ncbi:MAG: DNA gyrase inhibitor YacG [Nevskiales bacterium]
MTTPTRIGRCPRCGKSVALTVDNLWRPFCSERCKTVDFGNWLGEQHRIPAEDADVQKDEQKDQRED